MSLLRGLGMYGCCGSVPYPEDQLMVGSWFGYEGQQQARCSLQGTQACRC